MTVTTTFQERLDAALADVREEAIRAYSKFANFNSSHEGYAVILEELDELWDDVKGNKGYSADARAEAKQVAATAVRYMLDIANG